MKLIQLLHPLKTQLYTRLKSNEFYYSLFIPLAILSIAAEIVWLKGPALSLGHFTPFTSPEKRIYAIAFLFLIWILKYLLIDLNKLNLRHQNPIIQKKLLELQNRFQGAIKFLDTTITTKNLKTLHLNKLPWYLLIGPQGAGKTSLLANSDIQFILQRQFQGNKKNLHASDQCDWWITRHASIIDVPGSYLSNDPTRTHDKLYTILWQSFLNLIRKQRGKKGIHGILITLPAAEIIQNNDAKKYHALLRKLLQQIMEIQKIFPGPIPCHIILTKCDLLPGFSEFFTESNSEEIEQAWGITLPTSESHAKIASHFTARFNALIKKLNQQLIWRLHQERNPMLRPYIKDFPLQIERLKSFMLDFINKLSSMNIHIPIQGIYLTSALQSTTEKEENILDSSSPFSTSREVQIFKSPKQTSRPFFIKQFFTQGIGQTPAYKNDDAWKKYTVYTASAGIIAVVIILLGSDFQSGIKYSHQIQSQLADYQNNIIKVYEPNLRLYESLELLNSLQASANPSLAKISLPASLAFYSNMAQQKTENVYQNSLHTILIPEIKRYLEEYLEEPVNKEMDDVYAVLKAYLMIGDITYFNSNYLANTLQKILPESLSNESYNHLLFHLSKLSLSKTNNILLNTKIIENTRHYLLAQSRLKLSYIILQNTSRNATNGINIKNPNNNSFFNLLKMKTEIANIFTAKVFNTVISQDIPLAAQEASLGNWVLGKNNTQINVPIVDNSLIEQLRQMYIKKYVDTWETFVANIHLPNPTDLTQIDVLIVNLTSEDSPLLQMLKTVYENTYFEPIISSSPKLQEIGFLIDQNAKSQQMLYEIFASLQSLHTYLQTVINAENEKQAAFNVVSNRMLNLGKIDAITQLRIIAERSPKPIKNWLDKIANDSWKLLMQNAGGYLDTAWQNKVIHYYEADIADHYPFNKSSNKEVDINKFKQFFGNPGIVLNFYNEYLQNFVDCSLNDWHWKKMDDQPLPFPEESLRQIQQAMRIHQSFFPLHDNNLLVHFAMQPYKFGKLIKSVKLNISNEQFIDDKDNLNNEHQITWPNKNDKPTSVQFVMNDSGIISTQFTGNWGWFKLMNQSFESMINKNKIIINLSKNEHPVKYIVSIAGKYDPFLSFNLSHFHLPSQLTDERIM